VSMSLFMSVSVCRPGIYVCVHVHEMWKTKNPLFSIREEIKFRHCQQTGLEKPLQEICQAV
jgi:hypothetical protein